MAMVMPLLTAIRTNTALTSTLLSSWILCLLLYHRVQPPLVQHLLLFAPLHAAIPHLHLHQLHLYYAVLYPSSTPAQ